MKRNDLLRKLQRTLFRRRASLRRMFAERTRMFAVNDRSVGDSIDAALDAEQDELDSQLLAVESRELAAIENALELIREGHYGICGSCNKPIPAVRLQVLPYTTLCIGCQREAERIGHEGAGEFHWERVTDEVLDNDLNSLYGSELEFV